MTATALLFPGQGSQQVGMGRDLAEAYAPVRELYAHASRILGFDLTRLCHEGPEEALNDTANTQPALFVTCLATLEALKAEGRLPAPAMVAGHSVGELTALVAAGVMDFADGLRLVGERARLMRLAGDRHPGGMAAVLKATDEEVERACREASAETGRPVQIANYNAPGQVVISGARPALDRATEILHQRGFRHIVPLAVSIAAHSALMQEVTQEYRSAVNATPIRLPGIQIIGNVSAAAVTSVAAIRDELATQLTFPVRWTASVQWMVANGASRFIEVGPKGVLAGLMRRIDPSVDTLCICDLASVRGAALVR